MRIGILSRELYPYFYGGIGVQLAQVAQVIVAEGHTVEYFTAPPIDRKSEELLPIVNGMRFHFISSEDLNSSVPSLVFSAAADKFIRDFNRHTPLDALLVTEFGGESFCLQLHALSNPNEFKVPVIMTLHGASREVLQYNRRELNQLDQVVCLQEDVAMMCSNSFIVPSRSYWSDLLRRLPLSKAAVKIIPNLCDEKLFSSTSMGGSTEIKAPNVIFIGRLEPRKGVDLLLEAFCGLANEHPEVRLDIVGRDLYWSGYQSSFVEHWSARLPAHVLSRVTFHGMRPLAEVRDILQGARVAVFPSRWEPFGIVALEAMAAGTPVITAGGTGLDDVVGDSYDWRLEPGFGVLELREALERSIGDDAVWGRISAVASKRAQAVIGEGRSSLKMLLQELSQGEIGNPPAVPSELVAQVYQRAWSICEESGTQARNLLSERSCEIAKLTAEVGKLTEEVGKLTEDVLRQSEMIILRDEMIRTRDTGILSRDEIIMQLREQVSKLQQG